MLELIRSWLVGITCAAMIVALAEGLMPPGAVRKVGKLTGGLVLLLAILQPVLKLDGTALTRALMEYRVDLSAYGDELEEENGELMKAIIAEQSAAYIVDKAASMGIGCSVDVTVNQEGDYPVPETVTVTGTLTGPQREQLTRQIEADFAIPAERQHYQSESGGMG